VVQSPSNPQTLNRYTYCNNNPVSHIDPNGHFFFIFAAIFAIVKAAITFAIVHPIITAGIISATVNVASNANHIQNFGDFVKFAGIGYASGALGAGTGIGLGSALGPVLGQFAGGFVGSVVGGTLGSVTNTTGDAIALGISVNDAFALGFKVAPMAAAYSAGFYTVSYAAIKVIGAIQQANALRAAGNTKTPIGSEEKQGKTTLTVGQQENVVSGQALNDSNPPKTDLPGERGFAETPGRAVVLKGAILSRYGPPTGEFLSPAEIPFNQRGLPIEYSNRILYTYEVVNPIEVDAGPAANYGAGGGGMQYDIGKGNSVQSLIDNGYLKEI
jgi:hypothetical protein